MAYKWAGFKTYSIALKNNGICALMCLKNVKYVLKKYTLLVVLYLT